MVRGGSPGLGAEGVALLSQLADCDQTGWWPPELSPLPLADSRAAQEGPPGVLATFLCRRGLSWASETV